MVCEANITDISFIPKEHFDCVQPPSNAFSDTQNYVSSRQSIIGERISELRERTYPYVPKHALESYDALYRETFEKLDRLNAVRKNKLSCHDCYTNQYVIMNGSHKGVRKFICKNPTHSAPINFTTYTSYESQKLEYELMIEALGILLTEGGSYEGIARYFRISKYLLELGVGLLSSRPSAENIVIDDNWVLIYCDFSSSRISPKASIIMGKVNGKVIYDIAADLNCLTAWAFVNYLHEHVKMKEDAKVVFVTDGEISFLNPIRSLYPDAIHIRQFHNETCRGIVFCHFKYENKLYTLRIPWDFVLEEGIPPDCVKKYRRMRSTKSGSEKRKKVVVEDRVILWEGTVLYPRGKRNSNNDANKKVSSSEVKAKIEKKVPEESEAKKVKKRITYAPDTKHSHKIVFSGTKSDAKRADNPILKFIILILMMFFGGKYITSNIAEAIFGIKLKIKLHRTEKDDFKLLSGILKMNKKWHTKEEILEYLHRQIPFDLFRSKLYRRPIKDKPTGIEIIQKCIDTKTPIAITYLDGTHKKTARLIQPTNIREEQNGLIYIEAHCYWRNEMRCFRFDRICTFTPYNDSIPITCS